MAESCSARSGANVTPVIELYTSQGCSSCPPADRWLSALTAPDAQVQPVLQAFHVAYWDYIGWVDRFAAPVHTQRQRQMAAWNGLRTIYTPQVLRNGRDWRQWRDADDPWSGTRDAARVAISLRQSGVDTFEATVTTQAGAPATWGAYWTVTDSAHRTAVGAGENAGAQLHNDHVVRQYVPVGQYPTRPGRERRLVLHAVPTSAGPTRSVNLVLFDPRNGRTLQAVSLRC